MPKNKLSHIDPMLAMDLHRDRLAIIDNRNEPSFLINTDINLTHPGIPLIIISSIDQNFIKYFVQTWDEFYFSILEFLTRGIEDPHRLLGKLD